MTDGIPGEGIGHVPRIVSPENHARLVEALRQIINTEFWKGVEMQQIARDALAEVEHHSQEALCRHLKNPC